MFQPYFFRQFFNVRIEYTLMVLGKEVEDIISDGNFTFIEINCIPERFESCFSKMEFITAYHYMQDLIKRIPVQSLSFSLPESIYSGKSREFMEHLKNRNRIHSRREITEMEREFEKDFRNMSRNPPIMCGTMSLFDSFGKDIQGFGENIIFTGFNTETDIMYNVMIAADRGFLPIVLSDGVSGPWEMRHFNALEMMSRFSYVIDTRDVMELMGDHI